MKQSFVILLLSIIMQACVATCDCFDECADTITFELDTSAGQFIASELDDLFVRAQFENQSDWISFSLDSAYYLRFTSSDSVYSLSNCGSATKRDNFISTTLYAYRIGSAEKIPITNLQFITASDTASLYNLELIIRKEGRPTCKCVSTVKLNYSRNGTLYTVISEEDRQYVRAKVWAD